MEGKLAELLLEVDNEMFDAFAFSQHFFCLQCNYVTSRLGFKDYNTV